MIKGNSFDTFSAITNYVYVKYWKIYAVWTSVKTMIIFPISKTLKVSEDDIDLHQLTLDKLNKSSHITRTLYKSKLREQVIPPTFKYKIVHISETVSDCNQAT